jgi:pimeloyl-ACP methyl ester carboxylesterase
MMRGQGDPEAAKRMLTRPGYMALGMGLVARYPTRISKELLSEQLLTFGDAGFSDAFEAILSYDFRHRLGEIGCPVLVIQGENDILVPLGDAIEFCELIPSAELLTMADTGHVPMFERPVQFNDALLDFIAAPAAATG